MDEEEREEKEEEEEEEDVKEEVQLIGQEVDYGMELEKSLGK